MALSDPIADLLTRIRNAGQARHRFVDVQWSRMRESVARILEEEGFVEKVRIAKEEQRGTIRIYLKYAEGRLPIIQQLQRVSRPGCRRYVTSSEVPRVFGGMGISILSTSRGVITGQKARKLGVGGELMCKVW